MEHEEFPDDESRLAEADRQAIFGYPWIKHVKHVTCQTCHMSMIHLIRYHTL